MVGQTQQSASALLRLRRVEQEALSEIVELGGVDEAIRSCQSIAITADDCRLMMAHRLLLLLLVVVEVVLVVVVELLQMETVLRLMASVVTVVAATITVHSSERVPRIVTVHQHRRHHLLVADLFRVPSIVSLVISWPLITATSLPQSSVNSSSSS